MNCKENCRKKSNRNDKGEKMQKITDLRGIKDTAKVFLHMNIEETKFSPLVIKHPFTDSAMVCLSQTDGEIAFANIMEDTKAFTLWKEQVEKQIDTAEDVFGVYHLMTKSYLLDFLKYTESYLSREDFSKMLADIWIRTEAPNLDPNFKQKELLDLFRKSKQEEMMTEDEIETLRSLPETVSVYRGVTSYNAGKVKALYEELFTLELHYLLREVLGKIEGFFMLSYNDCEFIRELYKDFYITPFERLNSISQKYTPGGMFKELVITNYDLELRLKSQPKQLTLL